MVSAILFVIGVATGLIYFARGARSLRLIGFAAAMMVASFLLR